MNKKFPIAVLVSGSGSNLQAIIDAIEVGRCNAEIKLVISNKADAFALERCKKHNVPTLVVSHKDFSSREDFEAVLIDKIKSAGAKLVCLAGFMRVLSPKFIGAFPNAIINIHPALLPSFPGIHSQKQALDYGVKFTGCTVHFVNEGVDAGAIILQSVVPVKNDDTEETLAARILEQEHKIYPEAVELFASGRLKIRGRTVEICD